jgi:hypothetical protein
MVSIIYQNGSQQRLVHLNVQPRPSGTVVVRANPVGHYEGNTLVIDTIGIAVHDVSAIDRFGTPHTDAMHVVSAIASRRPQTLRVDLPSTIQALSTCRGTPRSAMAEGRPLRANMSARKTPMIISTRESRFPLRKNRISSEVAP